jgi:hypothetical protein
MAKVSHGCWWTEPKGEAHKEVAARVTFLEQQNSDLRQDNLLFLNIASNFNVDGSGSYGPVYWKNGSKIRRNVCAAARDTAASFIAANRTIPSYTTTNASFEVMRKARQRARVVYSLMWSLGAFDLGVDAFYDGSEVGTGITHAYACPETITPKLCEVRPNSCFVDAAEGRRPRSFYWVDFKPREWLLGVCAAKFHDAIKQSAGPSENDWDEYFVRKDNEADLVRVVEAWHLGVGKKPGRHVVTTSECTLTDESYEQDFFPFAFYHYARRRAGFWGQGLVERTLPAQLRIAEIEAVIKKCQDNGSNAVYMVEENSGVSPDEVTNLPGQVYTYRGTRPELVVWSGTPGDLRAEITNIWNETLEQEGLSQGVVGGELPQKGLSSARAVRAADDVASRRLVIPTRALEAYYLQIGKLIEYACDECTKLNPDFDVKASVRSGRQTFLRTSKWADLAMPKGDVTLTVMSMSAIPTTPQAKLAAVEELSQNGYMSKEDALALMEMPDVAAWQALANANYDLVEQQIEDMYDGTAAFPIDNQDLTYAKRQVNDAFLVAYRLKATPEVQQRFLDYLARVDMKLEAMAQKDAEAAAQQQAALGAQGAQPGQQPIAV